MKFLFGVFKFILMIILVGLLLLLIPTDSHAQSTKIDSTIEMHGFGISISSGTWFEIRKPIPIIDVLPIIKVRSVFSNKS